MTIKHSEEIENASHQNELKSFDEHIGMLSETAWQQVGDSEWELLKKQWNAAARQRRAAIRAKRVQYNEEFEQPMCNTLLNRMGDRQLDEGKLSKGKEPHGGIDHLLILAQSAELMSESEVCFHGACGNDQNNKGLCTDPIAQQPEENVSNANSIDQKSIGAQHDGMPASDNVGGEKDGVCCQGRIPRLSQIRRQARSKNHFLVQHNNGQYTRDHLQGRMPRLTQIRHQARSRNHLLVQDRIVENTGRHSQGKSIRLSHVRCQARSKHKLVLQESMGFGEITLGHTQGRITHLSRVQHQARARSNLFVQEGVGELVQRHSDCHTSGDNQRENVAAEQCEREDSCQVEPGEKSSCCTRSNRGHLPKGCRVQSPKGR